MTIRQSFVILLITLSVIAIIFPYCSSYKNDNPPYHNFLNTPEYIKLSRAEQVQKCASCHQQQYQNELKGPHASAYKKLTEHIEFVNSNKYNCAFYTKHVNESYQQCAGCHAPQNLFETMLNDSLQETEQLVRKLSAIPNPRPPARTDENSRATSIDCMSCHFDGNQMKSLKHNPVSADSIPQHHTLSIITQNNLNCFACHSEVIRSINPQIAINRTGTVQCVKCHQEYDKTGKGTHYYYWQHDAKEKVNYKVGLIMDDFHVTLSPRKDSAVITWLNTIIPHKISSGPEMIFVCDVLDKDSAILGTQTIRVNRKKEFDKVMYQPLGNNYHFGTEGVDVPTDGKPLQYPLPLKNGKNAAFFRISFIHKSQYWFPDSLGTITAVKNYPLTR